MSDEGAHPTAEPPGAASSAAEPPAAEPRTCAWCAAPATDEAVTCGSCGAALAQRESLGGVRIAGLTAVDPALTDYASRPMHLHGPSSSQGVAPALIVGAAAGGPIGAVLIGGVVAVAAAEYLGARQPGTGGTALDEVGKPSELALQALERERKRTAESPDPGAPSASTGAAPDADAPDVPAADDGRSIWRDLPEPSEDART